jgi:hypothetical protein
MKISYYILGAVACFFTFQACEEENLYEVGSTIQPGGDKSIVYTDTFQLQSSTVQIDSVYSKSVYAYLGELYDPVFGNLKSDYICQLYSSEGFQFRQTPIDGKIDSVVLTIFYTRGSWIGDSLAPMQAKVFPVIKQLDGLFYNNIDPKEYADMLNPLGEQVYTPRDMTVSDSIWNLTSSDDNYYYTHLRMKLPTELGQKFYDESVNKPGTFANQQSFNKFFPGLYVTNTFGSGNIIQIKNIATDMSIYYKYTAKDTAGKDTIIVTNEIFTTTPEVLQVNNFINTDITHLLKPNDEFSYLKTPAGVFTRLTLPTKEIFATIKDRRVNNAYLALKAMKQDEWKYMLKPADYLLLIPEDSVVNFFKQGRIDNSVTSFTSYQYETGITDANGYPSSLPLTYLFGNIGNMLIYYQANHPDLEELNLLVVPVERTFQMYNGQSTGVTATLNNYLRPSGVTLRKDPVAMQFQIITSKDADKD